MLISTVQVLVALIFVGISLLAVIPLVESNDAFQRAGTFVNS